MSLKALIIAVGVCVNMIQGEMPSIFPWQQQGLCFFNFLFSSLWEAAILLNLRYSVKWSQNLF